MRTAYLSTLRWLPLSVSSSSGSVDIHTHAVLCYACPLCYTHPTLWSPLSLYSLSLVYPRPSGIPLRRDLGPVIFTPTQTVTRHTPLKGPGTWLTQHPSPFVNNHTHVKILPFYCFTVAEGNNVLGGKY